jgi:hypothetical protein
MMQVDCVEHSGRRKMMERAELEASAFLATRRCRDRKVRKV